jgi:hypothetical protein
LSIPSFLSFTFRLPTYSSFASPPQFSFYFIWLIPFHTFKMLCKLWVASALCAVVLSAPTIPTAPVAQPASNEIISNYFNLLAGKVAAGKSVPVPPVCDLSNAVLPVACK